MTELTFNREWAMPNSNTFEIQPIHDLITDEINTSDGIWIDPFSGGQNYADITNDLNPEIDSDYTLTAVEFLQQFDDNEIDGGVLFDPPYSPRQIKEVYDSIGLDINKQTTQSTFWSQIKDEIQRICDENATVITFGWNSGGIGKTRGFTKQHILLVAHGGWHNDTICTVEKYIPV